MTKLKPESPCYMQGFNNEKQILKLKTKHPKTMEMEVVTSFRLKPFSPKSVQVGSCHFVTGAYR